MVEIAVTVLVLVAGYLLLLPVEPIGRWWVRLWHGEGQPGQYQFYRCHGCRRLVTHRHIMVGGCRCHESSKVSPAKLRLTEKARLLYLPWTVTSWKVRQDSERRRRALATRAMLDQIERGAS